jgi:glycosyltransferase involved in cell wall biosynthesis
MSLIIPAHNEEKHIGACLESATKNAGHDLGEIIVVDNASTDRTADIARAFRGVRVVRENQKGAQHARERGFREAKGEILAFVDADARIPVGWSSKILRAFDADPRVVCVSGPQSFHDLPRLKQWCASLFWVTAMCFYTLTRYMAVAGNMALKREALEKMGGFDTTIAFYGDDTDTARRAHAFGKVKFLWAFMMPTSGRRLARDGLVKMGVLYSLNFAAVVLTHRPWTKQYVDVR